MPDKSDTFGTVVSSLWMRRVLALAWPGLVLALLLCVFLSLVRPQSWVNTVSKEDAILIQEAIQKVEIILKVEAILKQEAMLKEKEDLKQNSTLKEKENSWLAPLPSHANHKPSSSGDKHTLQQLPQELYRLYWEFTINNK